MKRFNLVTIFALVAVLAFASVGFAQEDEPTTPPAQEEQQNQERPGFFGRMGQHLRDRMGWGMMQGRSGMMGPGMMNHGRMGPGMMEHGRMGPGMMGPGTMGPGMMDHEEHMAAVAAALGMSVEALETAIADGTSIRALAEEAGVDLHSVMFGLMAQRINEAVANGDLTPEEATEMLAHMGEMVAAHAEGDFESFEGPGSGMMKHGMMGEGFGMGLQGEMAGQMADLLGLTQTELRDAIRSGQTLDEIAEAQGMDLAEVRETLKAEALSQIEERLGQAVESGQMTQEQADTILERFESTEFGPENGRFPGRFQNLFPGHFPWGLGR